MLSFRSSGTECVHLDPRIEKEGTTNQSARCAVLYLCTCRDQMSMAPITSAGDCLLPRTLDHRERMDLSASTLHHRLQTSLFHEKARQGERRGRERSRGKRSSRCCATRRIVTHHLSHFAGYSIIAARKHPPVYRRPLQITENAATPRPPRPKVGENRNSAIAASCWRHHQLREPRGAKKYVWNAEQTQLEPTLTLATNARETSLLPRVVRTCNVSHRRVQR